MFVCLLSGLRDATMCRLGVGEATRSYLSSRTHLPNLDQAMAMLEMHQLATSPDIRITHPNHRVQKNRPRPSSTKKTKSQLKNNSPMQRTRLVCTDPHNPPRPETGPCRFAGTREKGILQATTQCTLYGSDQRDGSRTHACIMAFHVRPIKGGV